ncbi:MAG: DUF3450 domain-containing protein [Proteobacteria bacterium]|nr:DUF3450 domain-containing protein [Pseudomonadota bacterium]MBU1714097.1 DUF3450 domain-containing protein [Pseudomonadota bacterium]
MRLIILAVWALATFYSVEHTNAESNASALVDTTSTTIEINKRTQKEKERWALEKTELVKQKNVLLNDFEEMTSTKVELSALIEKTNATIAEFKNKSGAKTQGSSMVGIEALLRNLIERLETHTTNGLPFLVKERNARLELLRTLIDDRQTGTAEKYRRTIEAMLIEMEYARTVEVYQQTIEVAGDQLTANVLRIGSAALFYQSPDGLQVGKYSESGRNWEPLPPKYVSAIGRAIEIAQHQRAAELIDLPIGRVVR